MSDPYAVFQRHDLNVSLSRRVAETLLSQDPVAYRGLIVEARGSIVILRGTVVGGDAHLAALELAHGTEGASQVIDRLTVRDRAVRQTVKTVPVSVAVPRDPWWRRSAAPLFVASLIAAAAAWQWLPRADAKSQPTRALVAVEGSLYFDGQPAAGAELTFYPVFAADAATPRPTATVDAEGRFRPATAGLGDGAPPGDYVVTVRWPPGSPRAAALPTRYQQAHTSPLLVRIAPHHAQSRLPTLHVGSATKSSRRSA